MLGLRLEDLAGPGDGIGIWEDNWLAVMAFVNLGTQWRMGSAGPIGLDYSAIEPTLRLIGTPQREWPEIFHCLRVLERAALEEMKPDE